MELTRDHRFRFRLYKIIKLAAGNITRGTECLRTSLHEWVGIVQASVYNLLFPPAVSYWVPDFRLEQYSSRLYVYQGERLVIQTDPIFE